MSIITVVGAGMMGTAMCFPAMDNGHEVRLVGIHNRDSINQVNATGYHPTLKHTLPAGVKAYHIEGLQEALDGADLIICGVSSFGIEWFEENVIPLVKDTPILSVTKGLEKQPDGTLVPYPVAIMDRAAKRGQNIRFYAVGGPVISFELADRKQTSIAFCGRDFEELKKIRDMLHTDYYHISLTNDIAGLECAVAMKNAYALGIGLAIGLNMKENGEDAPEKYNPQAALFEQSAKEASKLLNLIGGRQETMMYFAGDLYVTVFGGRTRRIGMLLGSGKTYEEAKEILAGVTLESVAIAKKVCAALKQLNERNLADPKEYPLLHHINDILNGSEVNIPWNEFESIYQ